MTDEEVNQFLEGVKPKLMKEAHALLNGTRKFDVDTAAEDIVQDVMIECWMKGDLKEWQMRCVVMERCNDFLKGQDVRAWVIPMDMDELADVDVECRYDARMDPRVEVAYQGIRKLSPTLRRTMVAFYFDGDTCEEIALREGADVGAIKERLAEARRTLRRKLENKSYLLARSVA